MKIEHFALQVEDPVAMAAWWVRHLGMRVVRSAETPTFARFLADGSGRTLLEIYRNPKVGVPDYRATNPLEVHLALAVDDVGAAQEALLKAGATACGGVETTPAGDGLAMLRDPWGLPVQLVRRRQPMP